MKKRVILLLAEGFEEVEAVTPIDYLRRAGIDVTVAAAGENTAVTGSHGIKLSADALLGGLFGGGKPDLSGWDAVILPGGLPGAVNLAASEAVQGLLKEMAAQGKLVCAICASPARVLAPLGLLKGKNFTCYPGEEKNIAAPVLAEASLKTDRVVEDGKLITSRGAGTAAEFACAIIERLAGEGEGKKIAEKVLL